MSTYRTMYDAIIPANIPADAQMVAGYVNGEWAWAAPLDAFARWPHAAHIRIDVNGSMPHFAEVIDVEQGDATPATAGRWVRERLALGNVKATVYCTLSSLPAVQEACAGTAATYWVANWTGEPHAVSGTVGTQYKNTPGYDLSAIYDASWHPQP
jgi:hypothetical protein